MRLLRTLVLALLTLAPLARAAPGATEVQGKLTVHFFDVGQGDSELIVSPTGKTVLIDGGPPDHTRELVARVKALVHGPLDLVILTHPHLDHLGGLAAVIEAVGARRYMDDGFVHPGKGYSHLLQVVAQKVGTRVTPEADPAHPEDLIAVGLGGGATFTVLWPRRPQEPFLTHTRSDPNSNSIVGKLTFGKTAFLLAGDAEPETEAYLLRKPIDFHATVLKVGHHGGRHSSTRAWLDAIRPRAAVISCGVGNDYGHPGREALERLRAVNAQVYRTDQMGEVVAVSDGESVVMRAERGDVSPAQFAGDVRGPVQRGPLGPGERRLSQASAEDRARDEAVGADSPARRAGGYVASKRSQVFHRADCPAVEKIQPANRVVFTRRADAAATRRPAADCNP